jgi:FO synthase
MHAFSPMEIMYGSRRTNMSYRDYLAMLKAEGLGTIPGTAAEILDDDVREVLSHKKVDVRTWVDIITAAHGLGIRSSSTVMYGHIETPAHIAAHLGLLRDIQKRTGGFTEFVPLRFIHTLTALYQKGLVTPPPVGALDFRVYAVSRLMLRGWIDNLQTSWVKLGTELSQLTLAAGCNDFGGTLMEESITKAAGGDAGEYLPESEICALIVGAGRVPVQRTTTYGRISSTGAPEAGRGAGWRSGSSAVSAGAVPAA